MWKLLLVPLLLYAGIVAVAFAAQTALLFPARMVPAVPPPPGAQPLRIDLDDGAALHGVHVAPRAPGAERLVLLGFGGNAWNAAALASYLRDLYPEAHVVAFHYRGYAPSGGSPSAAALQADALRVHDLAVERLRPERIVALGFSVGSGVAASLAAERRLDGLILVTPFDSLTALAAGHYPWLPVRFLFVHRMEPAADLAGSRVPVAIVAAERDGIVPAARTDALRRAVPTPVFDRTLPGAGHNDLYDRHEGRAALREALAAVLTAPQRQ
jgi:uncharacterized protein